jgi:pyruvate dehydrogenase E2 component (dihydrolipoamide acetyltransferase)
MANAVIMPRQGQSVESCIITEWFKAVGDKVKVGEVLFSCETDKASFEVDAEFSGTMLAVLAEEGDDVPCLDNVCVIGEQGEDISAFTAGGEQEVKEDIKQEVKQEKIIVAVESKPYVNEEGRLKISPRAKVAANKQNVDLSVASATGPYGRIIERDVLELAKQGKKVSSAAAAAYQGGATGSGLNGAVTTYDLNAPSAAQGQVMDSEYEDVKISNVRKFIAKAMHESLSGMAQLTLSSSFDASQILAFRQTVKASGEALGLNSITMNDMILFAAAKTLKNHKDCNAHFLGDTMRYFKDVNMGMAVDTERGLLVPTVFGADKLSLNALSAKNKEVIMAAKSGNISPDLLTGGTFTVTNLGALGVESFTPVINPPQTCILGVCTLEDKIKVVNGEVTPYKSMGLSLTFDHRALDGAPAAMFLKELCTVLENFSLVLSK